MSSWLLCILYVLVSSKVNISPGDQQTLSNTGPLRSVCVCVCIKQERKSLERLEKQQWRNWMVNEVSEEACLLAAEGK